MGKLETFNFDLKSGVFRYKVQNEEDFRRFNKVVWQRVSSRKNRRVIVLFDEISMYIGNNQLAKYPFHKKMLLMGRAYGIGLWYAIQRPALVDKSILSQSSYIISFQMDDLRDLSAISAYVNPEEIRKLKPFWYLYYDDSADKVVKHAPV
ncbi:hypothetical protein WKT22_04379 [Candidatus Lokiarchaeum ossiferum]